MAKEQRQKPRYRLQSSLKAKVHSMGSKDLYDIVVENLSESGMLIFCPDSTLPYSTSSILELEMNIPEGTVQFLAKIARFAEESRVGIRIIQIEEGSESRLRHFLAELSSLGLEMKSGG